MAKPLIPVETIKYKTHLKRALVEGLRSVFADHPDSILTKTKVDIEFPTDEASYPVVIVRYFGRDVSNAGVAHKEWVQGALPSQPDALTLFNHSLYHGTVEFSVQTLSSYDRDLVSDTLVHIIQMGDLEGWTNQFFTRLYQTTPTQDPDSEWHYININSDTMQEMSESQNIAPWNPEDFMVYTTGYRLDVFGELRSLPPDQPYGLIEEIDVFPYIEDIEERPEGSPGAGVWTSEEDVPPTS